MFISLIAAPSFAFDDWFKDGDTYSCVATTSANMEMETEYELAISSGSLFKIHVDKKLQEVVVDNGNNDPLKLAIKDDGDFILSAEAASTAVLTMEWKDDSSVALYFGFISPLYMQMIHASCSIENR